VSLLLMLSPSEIADAAVFPTVDYDVAFADDATDTTPTWDDVSPYLLEFVTRRGRQMELDQVEAGSLVGTLNNQTRRFDPANTAGPHYPNVVPVRQTRLRVDLLGSVYDLFRGDVFDWPQEWQGPVNRVPLEAGDAFDALAAAQITMDRPQELSSVRVSAILDEMSWPAGMRSIQTGAALLAAHTYAGASALSALQEIALSEAGVLFVSPTGVVTFHNRHQRLASNSVQATFSNRPGVGELPFSEAKPTYRRERIYNTAAIAAADGTVKTAEDATSVGRFRPRAFPRATLLADPNDAQAMANWIVATYKDPEERVEEVVLEPQLDNSLWASALGLDIGDKIRVEVYPPGLPSSADTYDVIVESVEHTYSGEGKRWTTRFMCSPTPPAVTYAQFGPAQFGPAQFGF
jgi:hypothetical protein